MPTLTHLVEHHFEPNLFSSCRVNIIEPHHLPPANLQAYRPEHILGSLESRIRSDVLDALKEARLDALAAFESAKCFLTTA